MQCTGVLYCSRGQVARIGGTEADQLGVGRHPLEYTQYIYIIIHVSYSYLSDVHA